MKSREVEALRRALASRAAGATTDSCPSPEELWRAQLGEVPQRRRLEIIDHLAVCVACAEDWRLASTLREPAGLAEAPASRRRRRAWMVAAAAALAVIAGTIFWRSPESRPTSEYRALPGTEIRSLLPEDRPLARDAVVLRWEMEGEATAFDVRVATPDLETLSLARRLEASEYRVPADDLEGLSGDTLLWQVEAILPDGSRIVSPTFVLRLD